MQHIALVSEGTSFGQPIQIGCDLLCSKAWGYGRPKVYLSCDEDDYAYLSDGELGLAPIDPGTTEGDEGKPAVKPSRHNKWCCRACERSVMVDKGQQIILPNLSARQYNMAPHYRSASLQDFTASWRNAKHEGVFFVNAPDMDRAWDIARWRIELYTVSDGATFDLSVGIQTPVKRYGSWMRE